MRDYLLSIPERAIRSMSAVAGGLAREIGTLVLPAAVRRTRLYRSLVDDTLRFLIENVGGVEGAFPEQGKLADNFALRRAAGNGIEAIGLLTFRASPVWVLAALADLSGAGRELVREISGELKREGLLDAGREFETVDQMLDGFERTSGRLAEAVNTPPLDVAGLREEWGALRREASRIPVAAFPSLELIARNWEELKATAAEQKRSVFEISSLMALSAASRVPENLRWLSKCAKLAARRTGRLVADTLLEHYRGTMDEIRSAGYFTYWVREFRPYLRAAAGQFSPRRRTITERLLKRRK